MDDTDLNEEPTWPGTAGGPAERRDGLARKVVMAGIGCAATIYDTAAERFERFAERGQRVADDLQQSVDQVRRENTVNRTRFGDFMRSTMDSFLNGVNLPSKTDLDTINVKLNMLNRKLDDLEVDRPRAAEATQPHTPGPAEDELGT